MKLLLICLFLIFTAHSGSCNFRNVDTFEFGQNVGRINFSTSGSIGLLEKLKRVSITVPECMDLKYVRVDVNNPFGPPSVKFDWDTRSIIMEFSPLQYSVSQYTVVAKMLPSPYCASAPSQHQYVPIFPLSVD